MPKINSIKKLLAFLFGLVLMFLGVFYIGQLGVVKMMFGGQIASDILPIIHLIIQGMAYIALAGIVGLGIWAIRSYLRNRKKPNEPSDEVKAINEGLEAIKKAIVEGFEKIRTELRNDKSKK